MLVLVLSLALIVACSPADRRPSAAEWVPRWEAVQALVPPLEEIPDPPDRERCHEVFVLVREEGRELLPSPDPAVDGPVREWVEVADSVFFQCPPHTPPIDSFAVGYEELRRLAAEVDAGLFLDD